MGQRHQLFVIARINGKYRCLAAVHHQWLYGITAARQCLEILKIFSNSLNRVALEEELKMASTYDVEFWEGGLRTDDYDASIVPRFPFITTCLCIGAGFEQTRGYQHGVSIEPWQMKYNEGDNNNGITIFDITAPSSPTYCFVDFYGMESTFGVQLMSPLDATTYLRAYEDEDKFPDRTETWGKWQLIGTATLRDTWPSGDWQEPWEDQVSKRRYDEYSDESSNDPLETSDMSLSKNALTDSLGGGEPEREVPRAATLEADRTEKEDSKDAVGPLSLRSRTLASLAEALVCDGELDENALTQAQMLPDFWPAVKAALYKNADGLKSTPKTLELMYQCLKQERDVDAGVFNTISIPHLANVLERLSHHGQMQSLNLSGRPTLTKDELQALIKHTVGLQTLYLMGAPGSLSISDLTELRLPGDVYHPVLFERALLPRGAGPDVLNFLPGEQTVRHIAYVILAARDLSTEKSSLPTSGIDWSHLSAETSGRASPGSYVPLSDETSCQKLLLTDTPMPLSRLVVGIRNLFEWLCKGRMYQVSDISHAMASSFALGSSAQNSDPINIGVGPLSNELSNGTDDCRALRLAPREWSLIIIHPCPSNYTVVFDFQKAEKDRLKAEGYDCFGHKNKVYYAFVKCNGDYADLSVHDLHGFLKDVGGTQAEKLKALSGKWPGFHFYDRSDIHEALQKIYI